MAALGSSNLNLDQKFSSKLNAVGIAFQLNEDSPSGKNLNRELDQAIVSFCDMPDILQPLTSLRVVGGQGSK